MHFLLIFHQNFIIELLFLIIFYFFKIYLFFQFFDVKKYLIIQQKIIKYLKLNQFATQTDRTIDFVMKNLIIIYLFFEK